MLQLQVFDEFTRNVPGHDLFPPIYLLSISCRVCFYFVLEGKSYAYRLIFSFTGLSQAERKNQEFELSRARC